MNNWIVTPRLMRSALCIGLILAGIAIGVTLKPSNADDKPKPSVIEPVREKKLEWSNFMLQVQNFQTQARAAYAEAQLAENRAQQARTEADKVFAAMQAAAGTDYEPDTDYLQKTGDLRFRLKEKKEAPKDAKP